MSTTTKLYQADSYLRECTVQVIERAVIDGQPAVMLDRTIFYPTSGGQMHDTGYLDQVKVVDVRMIDDEIWHLLSEPLASDQARAVLDWPRRFDFMQQHTAFHILAGCFLKIFGITTLSSHLGEKESTIDVDTQELTAEQLQNIEEMANRIVWEDRLVRILEVTDEEARTMNVRKGPAVSGLVRLIEIADHDLDPCGGTHVNRTAQVGMIKIIGRERVRKNLRFVFVAGRRALSVLQNCHTTLQQLGGVLTTGVDELVVAVTKLMTEQKELRKKLREQAKLIGEFRLQELIQRAKTDIVVDYIFSDMDMETLRWLASTAIRQQSGVYLLASLSDRAYLVFASSIDEVDLRPVFKDVMAQIDGKGGGEAGFVQGSGSRVSALSEAMATARKKIAQDARINASRS